MSLEEFRAAFIGQCKNGIGCKSLFNHFMRNYGWKTPPSAPTCPPVNCEPCTMDLSKLPQQSCDCQCPDIDLSVLKPPTLHCPEVPVCPFYPATDDRPSVSPCLVSIFSDLALIALLTFLLSVGLVALFFRLNRKRQAVKPSSELSQIPEVIVDNALPSTVSSPERPPRGCLRWSRSRRRSRSVPMLTDRAPSSFLVSIRNLRFSALLLMLITHIGLP